MRFSTREEAAAKVAELKAEGHKAWVAGNGPFKVNVIRGKKADAGASSSKASTEQKQIDQAEGGAVGVIVAAVAVAALALGGAVAAWRKWGRPASE